MKKKHYISFIILTLIVAIIPFACNIYYVTPDDPRYIGLVSGAYTGTPVKELVYIGTLLGGFEAWLYTLLPNYEWYSIIYYLCTLLSFCSLLYCSFHNSMPRLLKFAVITLLTILQIHLSLTPQFTTLATQLSFSSLIVFLNADKCKMHYLLCVVLFFLATQMRLAAAFLPYMVACPILLKDFNHRNRACLRKGTWLIGLLIVACTTFTFDRITYKNDEWVNFNVINDARAYIADNPLAETIANEITNSTDKIAFDLLYQYRIFDLNILTPEKIKYYQQICADRSIETILYNIKPYLQIYWKMGLWIAMLIGIWLVYELTRQKQWWILFLYITAILLFVTANLQMMSFSFHKERVMFGTFISLLFITLYLCYSYARHANIIILTTSILVTIQYIPRDYKEICQSTNEQVTVKETENLILQSGYNKVMMTVPTCLTPEAFHTSQSPIYTHTIIQGWMHFYPKSNLTYQPFTAFTDGLPLLVDKKAKEQIDMIRQLIFLHYKQRTYTRIINESEHYLLLKIEKQ